VTVAITSPSDRALVSFLGSIASLSEKEVPRELFSRADHLHVSSFYLQAGLRPGIRTLFREARAAGLTTSLDPGFDPSEQWEPDLLETLYGDFTHSYQDYLYVRTGCDRPRRPGDWRAAQGASSQLGAREQ
jgi:sugar/nucleoside kinase (ribokinase family)